MLLTQDPVLVHRAERGWCQTPGSHSWCVGPKACTDGLPHYSSGPWGQEFGQHCHSRAQASLHIDSPRPVAVQPCDRESAGGHRWAACWAKREAAEMRAVHNQSKLP